MKVSLHAVTQFPQGDEIGGLNYLASVSRHPTPQECEGLFERTVDWGHGSLQEFVWYVFYIEHLSYVALAQLTRHRHASFNVQSGRHTLTREFFVPTSIEGDAALEQQYLDVVGDAQRLCHALIHHGVPLEDARYVLPRAMTVNLFMGINGRSLRNFLRLRLDLGAQEEIRSLAHKIYKLIFPRNHVLMKNISKNICEEYENRRNGTNSSTI